MTDSETFRIVSLVPIIIALLIIFAVAKLARPSSPAAMMAVQMHCAREAARSNRKDLA